MEVEITLMQGQVAIQADAEIIIQDGARRNGRLRHSRRLCGEAVKEYQSEQECQQRVFWHNVLFVLIVNYINNVHLRC